MSIWAHTDEIDRRTNETLALLPPDAPLHESTEALCSAVRSEPIILAWIHHTRFPRNLRGKYGPLHGLSLQTFQNPTHYPDAFRENVLTSYEHGRDNPQGGFVRAHIEPTEGTGLIILPPGAEECRTINPRYREFHAMHYAAAWMIPSTTQDGPSLGFIHMHLDLVPFGIKSPADLQTDAADRLRWNLEDFVRAYAQAYARASVLARHEHVVSQMSDEARNLDARVRFLAGEAGKGVLNIIDRTWAGTTKGMLATVRPSYDEPAHIEPDSRAGRGLRAFDTLFHLLRAASKRGWFIRSQLDEMYEVGEGTTRRWERFADARDGGEGLIAAERRIRELGAEVGDHEA